MTEWEYKTVQLEKDGGILSSGYEDPEAKLNELGKKRWEFVDKLPSAYSSGSGEGGLQTMNTLVFKRPVE